MKNKLVFLFVVPLVTVMLCSCNKKYDFADLVVYGPTYTAEEGKNSDAKAFAVKKMANNMQIA